MTATEKSQISIKFFVEIVSIILLFGGMFGTYKVTEWRVGVVEGSLTNHIKEQRVQVKEMTEEIKEISKKQVEVLTILRKER
jgi:hypothetical protein